MKKRNIQIDIDTARNWYLSKDSFKQELALKAFSKEELKITNLPKSWEEFTKGGYLSSGYFGYSNKLDVLERLLILRDIYRQGWKPDWKNTLQVKYYIMNNNEKLTTTWSYNIGRFLSFQSEKIRDEFLKNFRDLIEECKDFI